MVAVQRVSPGVSASSNIPRLSLLATPQVHPSAEVHEFSFLEGDVHIGAGAMVAPGTAVTADSGASVVLGEGCSLLPGVVLEGLAGAQVAAGASTNSAGGSSKASSSCSIWLGDRTVVAHKSIIHSPVFIGSDCFVGFRSTVFNARLGEGCVVMMHALVQDVEVPPGKCVPSGSVITSQHQADQLPNVRPEDLEFVKEVTGSALAGRSSGASQKQVSRNARGPSASAPANKRRSKARLIPVNSPPKRYSPPPNSGSAGRSSGPREPAQTLSNHSSYATEGAHMQATNQRLAPEIVQQVRQYLSQGYRIGMEHASKRRYRSGVWETCTPIQDTREQAVFEGLERCLAEHTGEYVRIFGIDAKVKRRVGMVTVQRPDGQPVSIDAKSVPTASNSASSNNGYASNSNYAPSNNGSAGGGGLTADIVQQVRNLLHSGFVIGTEHADARRYRSNVWKSCSPIKSSSEQEVLSRLEHCLAEHAGEYVRMFGIDTQAKRRLASTTIQRADGKPVDVSPRTPSVSAGGSQGGGYAQSPSYSQGNAGGGEAAQAVNQILAQGNQVGVEMADARRYRSGIWQTAPSVQSASQLQAVLAQNADKYVRIFGVNKAMKTRGAATTVQKPGQTAPSQPAQSPAPTGGQSSAPAYNSAPPAANGNGEVAPDVMNQVTQLVNQGCRIALEFADKRRYRSGIWQTGPSIESRRPADAIAALGQQLAQHAGDYVRLVGVDPQAKRRVLEATIQRP